MRMIMISTGIAFFLSVLLIPVIIKFCKFYNLYDTVNARKIHSGNIPRLGGIAIAVAFLAGIIFCLFMSNDISAMNSVPLLFAGTIIFTFGIIDDLFNMRALFKLFVQIVASLIVVACGFRFTQVFGWILPVPVSLVVSFFWILGIVNAYNLIDGMDGLCGGLSLTTLLTIGVVMKGSFLEGTAICFVLCAAILGFLVYNLPCPNAKIFMGDGGSQLLGFMVATVALYPVEGVIEYNKVLMMLVLVSFPMIDTIAAIWRRLREHRGIMSPDRQHLHHKLLNFGFNKVQVLFIILAIQVVLCITSIVSVSYERRVTVFFLAIAYIFMIAFFCFIHFANAALNRKIAQRESHKEN